MINEIKEEFNLNEKLFSYNTKKQPFTNKVKSDLIEEQKLPKIKAWDKVRKNIKLQDLMNDTEAVIHSYIQHNCSVDKEDGERIYLKYVPIPFFTIVDIFGDDFKFLQEMKKLGISDTTFQLDESDTKELYYRCVKMIPHIPDNPKYHQYFENYISNILEKGFYYFYADETDKVLAQKRFKDSFCYFFSNYIQKHYYAMDYNKITDDEWYYLDNEYKDKEIVIAEDWLDKNQKKKLEKLIHDRPKVTELIKNGFYFSGYKHSIYDYNKFDSYTEKQLADYLDWLIDQHGKPGKDFWVRNEREIYFQYGNHKYYPDFLFHHSEITNAIETKAEPYSNQKKNNLLHALDKIEGYRGLLIFSNQMDAMEKNPEPLESLLGYSEQAFHYHKYKDYLSHSVAEEEKFSKYLPVYSIKAAAGVFSGTQEANPEGWIKAGKKYAESCFVVQVKGLSMHPRISDGDLCIFDHFFTGSKNGQIVLVQHRDIDDSENGGKYTVKLYYSEKRKTEGELLENYQITLKPLNKMYSTMVFENIYSEGEFQLIGVFKEKLNLQETEN
ncbi:MAG: S24 family peptidase [Leptospiraceae bacterium]|nr:S24 family peptidase [Leptospiraceae bacterium]